MKFLITLILFNIFFLSSAQLVHPDIYPIVKKKEIKNYALTPGIHSEAFQLNNGKLWKIIVVVPEIKNNDKVPLIVGMHWREDNLGQAYEEYAQCLAIPAFKNLNGIIIIPQNDHGSWSGPMETRVWHLVKQIKKYWPIDSDEIILSGYGDGGFSTINFVGSHPKLYNVGFVINALSESSNYKNPIYFIQGKNTRRNTPEEVISFINESNDKGSQFRYRYLDTIAFNAPCSYKSYLIESIEQAKKDGVLKIK